MIKSDKKLTKAKKSCIKFGILSLVNVALGVTGLVLSSNPLITLVSVASLAVSGIWGVLAYRSGTLDKDKKRSDKAEENKQHKIQYKEAYKKKCEQVKKINKDFKAKTYKNNNPGKTEAQRKEEKQEALKSVPKSAKPYKFWKVTSIVVSVICSLIAVGSAAALADNFITASTLASEANQDSAQYIQHQAAVNTGIGIGIAGASTVGLAVAAIGAKKVARKREDEIIEAELSSEK